MVKNGREHLQAFTALSGGAPRIVVASNILLYREGLSASLVRDTRLKVLAAVDLGETVEMVARLRPEAVVLDAAAPAGREVARELKCAEPGLPVIGFGISESASDVIGCAEAGLAGFIDQDGSVDDLVATVTGALRGEFKCSPRVTTILCARLARLADRGNQGTASLTPREREIASMVAEGMSNKEIAKGLSIGPATVKNHVHNILDKLNVRRRAAIAVHVAEVL